MNLHIAMKSSALLFLVMSFSCVAGKPLVGIASPVAVRSKAFSAKDACIKSVVSNPSFQSGDCGTSGCMNAYMGCSRDGEAVVAASAKKAVAKVRHSVDSECLASLEKLLAVATAPRPEDSEISTDTPFDTSQSVGIVRRLAAYELIFLTVTDQSCRWNHP